MHMNILLAELEKMAGGGQSTVTETVVGMHGESIGTESIGVTSGVMCSESGGTGRVGVVSGIVMGSERGGTGSVRVIRVMGS